MPRRLAELLDQKLPKTYRRGTSRSIDPTATLAHIRPLMGRMGITRLGNITGLDRIGIPVAVAVRPNSRSVSVSQGKGLDLAQAMTSALMEAAEGFHAEEAAGMRRARYRDLAAEAAVVDPAALCATGKAFDDRAAIDWIEGYDLIAQRDCWLPAEIVHTDFTRRFDGFFLAGSNGLASGNQLVEAAIAAICELIERDGLALRHAGGVRRQASQLLDLTSVSDIDCRSLIDRYRETGFAVRLWNIATELGVPAFLCQIRDLSAGDPQRLTRSQGSGCHPDRAVALARALTEAAQTRLTYIAGIRDNLLPAKYREPENAEIADLLLDVLAQQLPPVAFDALPNLASDDLAEDLRCLLGRLAAAGFGQAIAVDLSRPDLAIPVVRVVIPGLEGDPRHPLYQPGPRARRAAS